MDDQKLLKLSKDLTLNYLDSIGAIVTETHGLYAVEIPPKYEKIFSGIKKRITFDLEVADTHSCEYVVPGSNFFATIINEIRKQAPVVSGSIKKQSNHPSEYLEKIKIHDGSASIIDSSEEENLAVRFYFQINIKSIKSTSMLKWIDLDLDTLEELEFPSDIDIEDKTINSKKDDPRIDLCFSKATEILDRDIKPLTAKYIDLTGDNLKRDIESLEISHGKRIKEIKNDLFHQKRKLKEIDRKIMNARTYSSESRYVDQRERQEARIDKDEEKAGKQIARLSDDKKMQALQIEKRYSPIIDSALIAAQIFSYSSTKCTLDIKTKFAQNKISAEFVDSYQKFIVNCDNCNVNSEQIHLCINSHVGCNLCTEQCVKCGKDVCQKCSDQFNPCYICREGLCDDCSSKCNFCTELTCSNHLMQCSHCSKTMCYFCSDNCEVCTKRFCNQTVSQCVTCYKRLCQDDSVTCMQCQGSVCQNDAQTCGICNEIHCQNDSSVCSFCKQSYSKNCVRGDNCTTCSNMKQMSTDDSMISMIIGEEPELGKFKKWEGASNSKIAVFKAKKTFGKRIIIFDVKQGRIISSEKKGLLS